MLTACAFWMTKISTTVRAAVPAISPVRMPLIFVRIRLRPAACGAGAGGAEPLADGGGMVLVVPRGAVGSVMACILQSGTGVAGDLRRFPLLARGAGRWLIPGTCFHPTVE